MKDNGPEKIKEEAQAAMDELDKASRKKDEFPEDVEVNMQVEIAEGKVDAIADAADEIIEAKEVGLKEKPKMREVINKAKEKRQYNLMWKDAKTLFLKGQKDELNTMMVTV